VTLARQPTTVKPLGGKDAGQAGCIAAPQAPINAILDVLALLSIDHIDCQPHRSRAVRSRRRADDQICSGGSP
jgi:hypothetical protein